MLASTKISRVVVALHDSDQRNNGKGIQVLIDNGITVDVGVASEEVTDFIMPYLGKS
jgi:pyrimidine deaminase RibD-like protein